MHALHFYINLVCRTEINILTRKKLRFTVLKINIKAQEMTSKQDITIKNKIYLLTFRCIVGLIFRRFESIDKSMLYSCI